MSVLPMRYRRRKTCPDCGGRLIEVTWCQPALFWLYGHGHTIRTTLLACARKRCGYVRHASTTTERPDT